MCRAALHCSWVACVCFGAAVEAARKSHDEKQLQSLKTQLEQKIAQNAKDAGIYLYLARIQEYLLDVYEMRKDKRAAGEAADQAIDAARRSIQLNAPTWSRFMWRSLTGLEAADKLSVSPTR